MLCVSIKIFLPVDKLAGITENCFFHIIILHPLSFLHLSPSYLHLIPFFLHENSKLGCVKPQFEVSVELDFSTWLWKILNGGNPALR
jgi:hypothetical protein